MVLRKIHPAYSCTRLNSTTFVLVHNDSFNEHPFIYAKLYTKPFLLVLFDTGCGAQYAADPEHVNVTNLRDFLETCPVEDNGGTPLNGVTCDSKYGKRRDYLIICSHCHYDHIGGIDCFPADRTTIVASGFDKGFLAPENLKENSECGSVGMKVPRYQISHFADDGEWLKYNGEELHLQALHTPGHTPDSLSVFDTQERWLFIGDSFYYRNCILPGGSPFIQPVIFPLKGNFIDFSKSMEKLRKLEANEDEHVVDGQRLSNLRIGCAHTTENAVAADILFQFKNYFARVMEDKVPVKSRSRKDGEELVLWEDLGNPAFSLLAPLRLKDEYLRWHKKTIRPIDSQSQNSGS